MIDPHVVMDKLAGLGNAHVIAEYLAAEQITGDHDAKSCPVSTYLQRESGERDIWVGRWNWHTANSSYITLPPCVQSFVAMFDGGSWPGLTARRQG